MSKTIQQHINDDENELDSSNISAQRRRHLESELQSLKRYQQNHPNNDHDPTYLEIFCDENPGDPHCKIYDL